MKFNNLKKRYKYYCLLYYNSMNYYIIPKNNFNININLQVTNEKIKPFLSYSLIFYLNDIYSQLIKLEDNINDTDSKIRLEYINKIVNPFEFIHTNVPGSVISVSKVKPESIIFFELMEVFQLLNINETFSSKNKINIAHLTRNSASTNYLLNMIREDKDDGILSENFNYDHLYNMFITNTYANKLDLIIFEFEPTEYNNTKQYIKNMLLVLMIIIKYQGSQGISVIKIDNIFYKSIIDILFILSAVYDKIYLVKPIISNITNGERYIICKSFNSSILEKSNLPNQINEKIIKNITTINNISVTSLVDNELPYYFLNKLEESNAVIGQQQLEAYDQIINIYKNKNRDEKIENLKRNHIQKCIQWCEKNQLPHNKFIDKVNIFLSPKKKDFEVNKCVEEEEFIEEEFIEEEFIEEEFIEEEFIEEEFIEEEFEEI